jgi:putative ABC transport system permease protein
VGRLLLISRLVARDIRRRPVQAVLLVVMIVTTTTTLTLALALRRVDQRPWQHTRAVTRGPDVVAELGPAPGAPAPSVRQFAPLIRAPGVARLAGPFPLVFVHLTAPGVNVPVRAEGRDAAPAALDRPQVTVGNWVSPGAAVLEQGLADSLGLHPGEAIRLDGRRFAVAGLAVTSAQPFYPALTPGLIWLTASDARRLATRSEPLGYLLDLKLADPASADAFTFGAAANAFSAETGSESSDLLSWQETRLYVYRVISDDQKGLFVVTWLLGLLAIASIAVLVGGRMADQTRRVGLLKAVGATPRFVAVGLLAENLLLGLIGAVAGIVGGELLAPALASPGSGLIGGPANPSFTVASGALVVGVAIVVVTAATIRPAIKGARTSTLSMLRDPARPPTRWPRLIALSAGLPIPLLLGLRLASRRWRRTALTAASLAIAVAMVVAAITMQHRLAVHNQQLGDGFNLNSSAGTRVTHLVWVLSGLLVVLASINAVFTTWVAVIDAERPNAVTRALGATPRQVMAGLTAAQLLPALVAAAVGIPAGLALFQIAGGRLSQAPPLAALLAIVPSTLIIVALLTALPARVGAHRGVAEALRTD